MIDLLRRDESSLDTFGRNAKGGIEKFSEPVGHLPGKLVRLGVRHERPPPTIGSRLAMICSASSTASGCK
jgi:hypothetical protein